MNNKLQALVSIQRAIKYEGRDREPKLSREEALALAQNEESRRAQETKNNRAICRFYVHRQNIPPQQSISHCIGCSRHLLSNDGWEHKTFPELIFCGKCLFRDYPPGGGAPSSNRCKPPICEFKGACGCQFFHKPVDPLPYKISQIKALWEE